MPTKQRLAPRRLDELAEALHRLADADRADDRVRPMRIGAATYITERGGSPSTSGVVRAPYSPSSASRDVAPLRVVVAGGAAERVEQTRPCASTTVDAQLDARLLEAEDVGASKRRAYSDANSGTQRRRCAARRRRERCSISAAIRCERLDQRLLGRLAVARIDVGEQAHSSQPTPSGRPAGRRRRRGCACHGRTARRRTHRHG